MYDMATISEALAIAIQHHNAGRLSAAEQIYRQILAVEPNHADALHLLGVVAHQVGEHEIAVQCIQRAIALNAAEAPFHNNLGTALRALRRNAEAVACCRRAVELNPNYVDAHYNLGNGLKGQGKLDEAIACYRRALELRPDYAEAYNNLGTALNDQGKLDEAAACYHRALELKPNYAEAHNNLGLALHDQGKLDEAVACYGRAIELNPDYADPHLGRALARLLVGDWQRGWPEYQWRWQTKDSTPRHFPQPPWNGESLAAKTILLHAEQGLGDTIQFIRYAPIVKRHGAAVIVECQKPLVGLLEGCAGVDRLVGQGDDLPAFDVHAPLLSVPGILKTSLVDIPVGIPYLFAKPALVEFWRKRLAELDGFKVGIAWQGSPAYRGDRFRSIPLRCFAALAQIPGVRLISLQKGAGVEQLAEVCDLFAVTDLSAELDERSGPFMDTAAVMKSLDLVITSDTASAHLAGALGAAVWVALPLAPDWRWLLDRCDSPWYPTMRLFRQTKLGDWQGVFQEIAKALCQRLNHQAAAEE
jgi:tetratricopeptide (TPR) repeat protein